MAGELKLDERRKLTKLYRVGEAAYKEVASLPGDERVLYAVAAMLLELKSPVKRPPTKPLPFTAAELLEAMPAGVFTERGSTRAAWGMLTKRIRDTKGVDADTPKKLAEYIERRSKGWKRMPLPLDVLAKNFSVWLAAAESPGEVSSPQDEVKFAR